MIVILQAILGYVFYRLQFTHAWLLALIIPISIGIDLFTLSYLGVSGLLVSIWLVVWGVVFSKIRSVKK